MTQANWYALYVRPRHEFVVSEELQRKGIDTFLPSVTKLRQWKDRTKQVAFPLFPGYLFIHVQPAPEEFIRAIRTKGTVSFVSLNPGTPTPVAPQEINSLKIVLESGEPLDIYPELKEGYPVRITKGVFEGALGFLEKKNGQCVFIVRIELLGRSVGVPIHADDLEAA